MRDIIKGRADIVDYASSDTSTNRKTMGKSTLSNLYEAVFKCFVQKRALGIPSSGLIIRIHIIYSRWLNICSLLSIMRLR